MKRKERQELTEKLLLQFGDFEPEEAKEAAKDSVDDGEPILETLCFQILTMDILSPIHTTSWLKARAKDDDEGIIKRLIASGAGIKDLAHPQKLWVKIA
jgi:hypothetical protein